LPWVPASRVGGIQSAAAIIDPAPRRTGIFYHLL
jgi:hypothetical protein